MRATLNFTMHEMKYGLFVLFDHVNPGIEPIIRVVSFLWLLHL